MILIKDGIIDKIAGLVCWPKRPTDKHIILKWLSRKLLKRKNDGLIYWRIR